MRVAGVVDFGGPEALEQGGTGGRLVTEL